MTSSLLKRLVQTCLGVGSPGQVAREGRDESGDGEREAVRPKDKSSGSDPNPLRHNPLEVTLLGAEPIQVINGNPSQRVFKATWCGRSPVQLHVLQFCKRPNPLAQLPGPNSPHATVSAALDAPPPVQANMMVQPDMVAVATEVEAALVQLLAEPLPNVVPVLACAKVSCRAHISSPGDDQVTQRVMAEVHVVTTHVVGLLSLAEWLRSRGPPPKAGSSDEPPGQQQQRCGTGAASTATAAAASGAPTAAAGRSENRGRGQVAKGGDAAPGAAAPAAAAVAAAPDRAPVPAAAAAPAPAARAGGPQAVGESTSANGFTPGGESSGSGSGSGPVTASCLLIKCLSTAPAAAGSKPAALAAPEPGSAPAPAPATAPAAAVGTQAAPPAVAPTAAAAPTAAPTKLAPGATGVAAPAAALPPRRLGAAAAGAGGVGAGRPGALPPAPRPPANPFVPVLDAVEVLLAVAEALKGLHRKGIPHGHITPSVVQLQLAPAPPPPQSASAASQQGQGQAAQQERNAGNASGLSSKSSKTLAAVDNVMAGFLTPEDRPASQQAARGPSTSTPGDAGEPSGGASLGQGGEGSGSNLSGPGLLGVHRDLGSVGSSMGSTFGVSVGPFRPFAGVPGAELLGPGGLPTVPEGSGTATSTNASAQLNTDNTHTSLSKSASTANTPGLAAGATSAFLGPNRATDGPSTSTQPGSMPPAPSTPIRNSDLPAAPAPPSSTNTDITPARPAISSAPVTTILPSAFTTAASIPLPFATAPASATTSRQPASLTTATAAQALRLRAMLPLPALCPAMLQMLTWGRARPVGLPQEQLLWAAPELLNTGLGPSIHLGWGAPHLLANKGSGGGMGGGSLGAEHVGVRNGRRAAAAWGGRVDHSGTHTARPEREWSRDREGGREGGHHGGMGGSLGANRRYRSHGAPLLLMGKDPHSASNACGITPACDVYALGLLMWHLMSGAQPLSHLATNEVLRLKELGWLDEQLPFGAHVPMAYVDLARRCWSPAPMSRPPVTLVAQELRRLRSELQQLAGRGAGPHRVPSSLLPLLDTSGRHRSAVIAAMESAVGAGGGHGGGPSSAEDNGEPTMDSRLSFTLSVALSSRAMSDDGSMLARPPLELALGVPPPPPGAATAPGALHSLGAGGLAAAAGSGDGGDGSGDRKLVPSASALPPPPTALSAALLTALTARNRDADGGGGGCMDDDSYMSYTDTDRFTDHAETVTERSASIGTVNSSTPTIGNSGRAKLALNRVGGSLGGPLGKWQGQGGSTENARQQQLQQAQQQAAQQGGVSGAAAMFLLNMGLGNTWGSCGPVGGAGPGLKRRQAACAADTHRPRGSSQAPGAAAGAPPPAGPSASSSASASGGNGGGGGGGSGRMPTAVAAALGLTTATRHF